MAICMCIYVYRCSSEPVFQCFKLGHESMLSICPLHQTYPLRIPQKSPYFAGQRCFFLRGMGTHCQLNVAGMPQHIQSGAAFCRETAALTRPPQVLSYFLTFFFIKHFFIISGKSESPLFLQNVYTLALHRPTLQFS